jgi:hypothetical protein
MIAVWSNTRCDGEGSGDGLLRRFLELEKKVANLEKKP